MTQLSRFRTFADNIQPHNTKEDAEVLGTRVRMEAALKAVMERIKWSAI